MPWPAEGFDGAAVAAGGRAMWHRAMVVGGEIGLGVIAIEGNGSVVVGAGGDLESSEPDPGLLPGVTNLGGNSTPWALANAKEAYSGG